MLQVYQTVLQTCNIAGCWLPILRTNFRDSCTAIPVLRNNLPNAVVQYPLKKLHYQQLVEIYKPIFCTTPTIVMVQNSYVILQNYFVLLQNNWCCTVKSASK
jgi:hypothetical protein